MTLYSWFYWIYYICEPNLTNSMEYHISTVLQILLLIFAVSVSDGFYFPKNVYSNIITGINEDGMVMINVSVPFNSNVHERYVIDVSAWNSQGQCHNGFESKGSCETSSITEIVDHSYHKLWSSPPIECSQIKDSNNQTVYPPLLPNPFWSGVNCEEQFTPDNKGNKQKQRYITYMTVHDPRVVDECTFRNNTYCRETTYQQGIASPIHYLYSNTNRKESSSSSSPQTLERRYNLYINKITPSRYLFLETKLDLHYDVNPAYAVSMGNNYLFCGPLFHSTATYGRIDDYFATNDLFENILREKLLLWQQQQQQSKSEGGDNHIKNLIISKYRISMLLFLQSINKNDGSRTYRGNWYLLSPAMRITNIYQALIKGTVSIVFSQGNSSDSDENETSSFVIKSIVMTIDDIVPPSQEYENNKQQSLLEASPMILVRSEKLGPCEPLPKVLFEQYHRSSSLSPHGSTSSTSFDECGSYHISMESKSREYDTSIQVAPLIYVSDEITGSLISISSGNDNVVPYLESVKLMQKYNGKKEDDRVHENGNYSVWLDIRWTTRCYYPSSGGYQQFLNKICYISNIAWEPPKDIPFFEGISTMKKPIAINTVSIPQKRRNSGNNGVECRNPDTLEPYFDINSRSYYCIQRWKSLSHEQIFSNELIENMDGSPLSSIVGGVYKVRYTSKMTSSTHANDKRTFSFFIHDAALLHTNKTRPPSSESSQYPPLPPILEGNNIEERIDLPVRRTSGNNEGSISSSTTTSTTATIIKEVLYSTTGENREEEQQQQEQEEEPIRIAASGVDNNNVKVDDTSSSFNKKKIDEDDNFLIKYNGAPALALIFLALILIFGTVVFAVKRTMEHRQINQNFFD
jgi:hypothetical protein